MKFRSLILVACMLIVPALAMFSHHIPAEVRAAVRRTLRETVADCLGRPAEASGPQPSPADRSFPSSGAEVGLVRPTPVAAGTGATAAGLRPIDDPAADAAVPSQLVAQLADRSRQARDQQSIETRLRDLGAVSFDCQPLPGVEGQHSSSCRVPVDSSGQLQRVFQAAGPSPAAASENLIQQVAAWRQRAATQPAPAVAVGTADQGSTPRFR